MKDRAAADGLAGSPSSGARDVPVTASSPSAASASITVVTPWLNCHELAQGYWDAMRVGRPDEVLVVDNGSVPPVDGAWHRFDGNVGFNPANNYGLKHATSDAVLFLNNDVRHTERDWLEPIRAELRPGVLVGAALRADPHTAVDGRTIPYLDGWCLAGMRDDLLALGGWDEDFEEPSYYGDNDLCLRARAAGMRLVQVNVGLRHLGNYTSRRYDVTGASSRNRARYVQRVRELTAAAA